MPKRKAAVLDQIADEFLCPITHELPVRPVYADDGRVYEKEAIRQWLRRKRTSPVTNQEMGSSLRPAIQVRNAIRSLIEAGVVPAEKSQAWTLHLEYEKAVEKMRRAASCQASPLPERGDAAFQLGYWHTHGTMGLVKDAAEGLAWYKRGAELGHASSMDACAYAYTEGRGDRKCTTLALVYMGMAANAGSQSASFRLARIFLTGSMGMPRNVAEARRWFEVALQSPVLDLGAEYVDGMREWLAASP